MTGLMIQEYSLIHTCFCCVFVCLFYSCKLGVHMQLGKPLFGELQGEGLTISFFFLSELRSVMY